MERDLESGAQDINFIHFNSHAHVERDLESGAQDINFIHFNSHAHVERDAKEYLQNAYKIISTHTLTWSVTIEKERSKA